MKELRRKAVSGLQSFRELPVAARQRFHPPNSFLSIPHAGGCRRYPASRGSLQINKEWYRERLAFRLFHWDGGFIFSSRNRPSINAKGASVCMKNIPVYNPQLIEGKWQRHWEENHSFAAEKSHEKPKFYPLI